MVLQGRTLIIKQVKASIFAKDIRENMYHPKSGKGVVCSTQPLANLIGASILQGGGNCVDAAVAMAAAMGLVEPCSTGVGGDAFLLHYGKGGTVTGYNGSGRSAAALTPEMWTPKSVHCVTVPGAVQLWCDVLAAHGTMSLSAVLAPAIRYCVEGYPAQAITSAAWGRGAHQITAWGPTNGVGSLLPAPSAGQLVKNPHYGATLQRIAGEGRDGYYRGATAERIVDSVRAHGGGHGVLTMADLDAHTTSPMKPMSVPYRGRDVWELPPNTQGVVALIALRIMEKTSGLRRGSYEHYNALLCALRYAFRVAMERVCDDGPMTTAEWGEGVLDGPIPTEALPLVPGHFATTPSDTVYFSVVDGAGEAASFIQSTYQGFGTGLVPEGCGFSLQNRGANFTATPGHPNQVGPSKRPYHTIIPAMITRGGALEACLGVMGGFMQPQGHVQVIMNMYDWGMDPQAALDAPRLFLDPNTNVVSIEGGGCDDATAERLRRDGWTVVVTDRGDIVQMAMFGRGQIIHHHTEGVWVAGSDPRGDGYVQGVL